MISSPTQPLWRRASMVSALVFAGVSLTGCSMINNLLPGGSGANTPSDDGEGVSANVFDIQVGDCLGEADGDTVTDVTVIDCERPHSYEVYYDFLLTGDKFPGDDAVTSGAEEGCLAKFESFVGVAYDSSELDFTFFSPIEEGWNQRGDKLVSCLITDPAGATSGSLAGSAR